MITTGCDGRGGGAGCCGGVLLLLWCVELVFDFGVESLWDADGWAKALAGSEAEGLGRAE